MRVLINASTVKYGGGLSEVLNFLNAFKSKNKIYQLFLLSSGNTGFERFEPFFEITYIPDRLLKWKNRYFLDNEFIKKFIAKNQIEVILSFGNLPLPTKVRQIFLFNNPFFTIEDLKQINYKNKDLHIHQTRNLYIKKRMKYVNLVLAQTEIQAKKLNKFFPDLPVKIIGNPPNIYTDFQEEEDFKFDDKKIKLLCFTRYYPHKNLEILLEVAGLIKQKNKNYQILVTLEKNQHKNVEQFLKNIDNRHLSEQIINIGYVQRKHIQSLYSQIDALILPTLMESFSTTYTDAMQYEVPILTSNLNFAKEACGDAALFFDPLNPDDIFKTIDRLFSDDILWKQQIKKEKEKLTHYKNWHELADEISKIIEE